MADIRLGTVRQLADGGAYVELEELPGFKVGPLEVADGCAGRVAVDVRVIVGVLGLDNFIVLDTVGAG